MSAIKKEVVCLQCPFACRIGAEIDEQGNILSITNNRCPRGKSFAEQEITNPVRVLTTTVRILSEDDEHPLLPVQTQNPISKDLLKKAMKELAKVTVKPPIKYGDVVMPNILNTGIDVIATFEILR